MKTVFILLFCCLVGVHSQCSVTPPTVLPDGCKINNLVVTLNDRDIIFDKACNLTIDFFPFNDIPKIDVGIIDSMGGSARSYLLAVVDRTSDKLLWMISNVVRQSDENLFIPIGVKDPHTVELIPYNKPTTRGFHIIEFLVFEEYRNLPSSNYNKIDSLSAVPFNLSTWINSQENSSITVCGPVAGGSVVARGLSGTFPLDKSHTLKILRNAISERDEDVKDEDRTTHKFEESNDKSTPPAVMEQFERRTPPRFFPIQRDTPVERGPNDV